MSKKPISSLENLPKVIFFGALVLIGYISVIITLVEIVKDEEMIGRTCNQIPEVVTMNMMSNRREF